jgi:hypothetical protein
MVCQGFRVLINECAGRSQPRARFRDKRSLPYGPSRKKPQWKWIGSGAAIAALVWLLVIFLLRSKFRQLQQTQDSLGGGMMDAAVAVPERNLHVPVPAASSARLSASLAGRKRRGDANGAPKRTRVKSREVGINPSDRMLDHSGYATCRPEGVKEVGEVSCDWGRR